MSLPAFLRTLFALLLSLMMAGVSLAADDDFLDPEVAFKFSARMVDPATAEVTFAIADGYYMYRERLGFRAEGAKLGKIDLPAGKVKFDETFQKDVETYRKSLTIRIPVDGNGPFKLIVTSQGCADKGLCYAPIESTARLVAAGGAAKPALLGAVAQAQKELEQPAVTPAASATAVGAAAQPASSAPTAAPPAAEASEMGQLRATLMSGRLLVILPLFFLLGLGLSFTPCVLPMVPILSSIIVGDCSKAQGDGKQGKRGFVLALAYALGMAIVYTSFGVAAGLVGEGLAATLQKPAVLIAFALLMVLLSLSMFGFYQLQLPSSMQSRLVSASGKQAGGKLFGVFIMGALSALIVGPCVAAPLASALVYISQTRDVVVGGSALFAMAMGMSVPLLLIGLSSSLVPRAGAWMEQVKRFFGVLMLAVAIWMVSPLLPGWAKMLAWAALGLGYGSFLLASPAAAWVARALGFAFLIAGGVQLAGVVAGGRDMMAPFGHIGGGKAAAETHFTRVKSSAELDAALAAAGGRVTMLDFYADWCVSCKEMEKFTFVEERVQARLAGMQLLQIDVTANNDDDKAMLKRFGLFGPPGIVFFGKDGKEIPDTRVIGFQDADKFLRSLTRTTAPGA